MLWIYDYDIEPDVWTNAACRRGTASLVICTSHAHVDEVAVYDTPWCGCGRQPLVVVVVVVSVEELWVR